MKAEDQNMDEQFRKAAEESYFSYRPQFWDEVESQLADDSMDNAFRNAAGNLVVAPSFSFEDDMADAYLDEAFGVAASTYTAQYSSDHWKEFLEKEADLEQDVAFNLAANSVTADYHSAYWSDADIALQNEGLHYEYQPAFWNEARQLLDRADRSVFFMRWSAVAAILLLLSIGGLYQFNTGITPQETQFASGKDKSKNNLAFASLSSTYFENSVTDQSSDVDNVNLTETELANQAPDNSVTSNNNDVAFHDPKFSEDSDNTFSNDPSKMGTNNLTNNAGGLDDKSQSGNSAAATTDIANDLSANSSPVNLNADPLVAEMQSELKFSYVRNRLADEVQSEDLTAPTVEIKRLDIPATHQISFVANAGVGNRYSKIDFIPSLRTSFGMEYMRTGYGRFPNLEFGASLNLSHARQNDFGTERRVSVFNTDGGIDKFWYKLQLKDMIYTNLSGIASYKVSPKQRIRLSFGIDYLMFVQSNMSYQVEADQEITTINNNWGVKDGLSKFDLHMGFGYEYQFSQRFSGQVNGNLGFFDRTDDKFIEK
jgi:hypothetical protein